LFKGCVEGEQSLFCKEGVRPSLVIGPALAESGPLVLLAQDSAQPSPD
jgi:hypothetical protein